MNTLDRFEQLFIYTAFTLQAVLIVYFGFRKWSFDQEMKYRWIAYALALPALVIVILIQKNGKSWSFWLGGVLFAAYGTYGFIVDRERQIPWRSPPYWLVFIPYVFLYLSSLMFYWWPVGMLSRPLWYAYAVLFLISTFLNITSHA